MDGETECFLTGLQRAITNAYLDPLFELGKFMFESGRLTRKLNLTFASKKTCYWHLNCSKVSTLSLVLDLFPLSYRRIS